MPSLVRRSVGALCLLAISATTLAAEPPPTPTKEPQSVVTAHARLLSALQVTAEALRSRSLDATELPQFHELLAAAEAYWQDPSVPLDRRAKWCGLAKARLAAAVDVLRRQQAKPPQTVQTRGTTLAQVGAIGGIGTPPAPAANEADALIELITTVVRPETWSDNGGDGVIRYWSLGNALIIHNTHDVHERIGGSLGALRK